MAAFTNHVAVSTPDRASEPTQALRALQNSILSELPGAAFALITLVYVVASLISL